MSLGALDERVADQVGVPGDEIEIGQIDRRQRIQMQVGARKGQTAFRLQLEALPLSMRHAHQDTALLALFDRTAQLAVVERHLGANRQVGEDVGRLAHGLSGRFAAERRRVGHQAEPIAGQQTFAGLPSDVADTELGPGDVHQHGNAAADRIAGPARVLDHRRPGVGGIVRAVDPHDIGATPRDLEHVSGVVCGIIRQRYQHAAAAVVRRAAQQSLRIGLQPRLAVEKLFAGGRPVSGAGRVGQYCRERALDRLQRDQHTAFQPAERGQAMAHQFALQVAQIVMAEREVVRQVLRAVGERRQFDVALPAWHSRRGLCRDRLAKVA